MVIAKKDVLDAGLNEASDHLLRRGASAGEGDFGHVPIEGKLALAALGWDDRYVSRCRIHVLKEGHAVAQVAVIGWTVPCHLHQNVRVGRPCRCRGRHASTAARENRHVIANIGEHRRCHHRQRHRVDHSRRRLGDANDSRLFVIAPKGVDFGFDGAAADHDPRGTDSGDVGLRRPHGEGSEGHVDQDEPTMTRHKAHRCGWRRPPITRRRRIP